MQIIITSKKPVLTANYGHLPAGIPTEVDDHTGKFLIEHGVAALVEHKTHEPAPVATKPKPKSKR